MWPASSSAVWRCLPLTLYLSNFISGPAPLKPVITPPIIQTSITALKTCCLQRTLKWIFMDFHWAKLPLWSLGESVCSVGWETAGPVLWAAGWSTHWEEAECLVRQFKRNWAEEEKESRPGCVRIKSIAGPTAIRFSQVLTLILYTW